MNHYTTDVYEIKRENILFSKKLTKGIHQVESKFIKQMIYGMTKSQSVILSNIADGLKEDIKKVNTVERLSRNLDKPLSNDLLYENYMKEVNKVIGEEPVILVDDTDVIKPYGKVFQSLGEVKDGSSLKARYEKGYMVTELVALTEKEKHPVSLYSHIHSSHEKGYKSINDVTFHGMNRVIEHIKKRCTFVFDRGYDANKYIRQVEKLKQSFILRLTERRNLYHKGKLMKATTLRDSRKGKIKTRIMFQKEIKDCYITHLNVKTSASKKEMRLVLVYGLGETPMMLLTNKTIRSKEDAIKIVRLYMSRWRIEDYFRFKKQTFGFEDFRVRSLQS
ncbi:MAG TPA: transposase, partial [Acholeplasmataceae bacterium]|nr:transposase [Acholeplasmataceae bacterium]